MEIKQTQAEGKTSPHRWAFPDVNVGLLLGLAKLPQMQNHKFILLLVIDWLHFLWKRQNQEHTTETQLLLFYFTPT